MAEKKPSANSQEDVLQFLEDLDTYSKNPTTAIETRTGDDAQSVLDYIDQIVQTSTATAAIQSNRPGISSTVNNNNDNNSSAKIENTSIKQSSEQKQSNEVNDGGSDNDDNNVAWSWGNILATASTAYKTATTVVDSSVKGALATVETVRTNEATKKLEEKMREYVNKETIEKIGSDLKSLSINTITSVVNAVVPPISQYEIVEVWLAHDMIGYIGLEPIVYRGFIKVMEQVEGGEVILKNGNNNDESKRIGIADDELYKDLNACEGFVEAVKLAKANIEQTIKKNYDPILLEKEKLKESQQRETPSIRCPVFMAIQPTKANPYTLHTSSSTSTDDASDKYLFFVIVLTDPTHNLTFKTYSQALPVGWLDVKYEENEWVEDKMVTSIDLAVQTIAQDYVWHRMNYNNNQTTIDNSNSSNDSSAGDDRGTQVIEEGEKIAK